MVQIEWNEEKNKLLKQVRGVGFEDVVKALLANKAIESIELWNKGKYANQRILVVIINNYTKVTQDVFKQRMKNPTRLTKKEQEILEGILKGDYSPVQDMKEHLALLKKAAANTSKNKNINIRINEGDLVSIKQKALQKGIPYQTLVSSVLHQYATEQIKVEIT